MVRVSVGDGLRQVVDGHLILLVRLHHKVAEGKTPPLVMMLQFGQKLKLDAQTLVSAQLQDRQLGTLQVEDAGICLQRPLDVNHRQQVSTWRLGKTQLGLQVFGG